MAVPTLVMATVALALLAVAVVKGEGKAAAGLTAAMRMVVQVLPLLVFAFVVGGLVQVKPEDVKRPEKKQKRKK